MTARKMNVCHCWSYRPSHGLSKRPKVAPGHATSTARGPTVWVQTCVNLHVSHNDQSSHRRTTDSAKTLMRSQDRCAKFWYKTLLDCWHSSSHHSTTHLHPHPSHRKACLLSPCFPSSRSSLSPASPFLLPPRPPALVEARRSATRARPSAARAYQTRASRPRRCSSRSSASSSQA